MTEGHSPAQTADLWDVSGENHDAALLLREPFADRIGTALLAATALAASFVLGWTGGANWHDFTAPVPVAQKEAPVPHVAEAPPSRKSESPRRIASNADPAVTGSIPKSVANPRPQVLGAAPTTLNAQAMALGPKQPAAAAPETRPSTVPGWSVVEVRDGTAVLEGPEGVKMAARGDVVPGLGRVDSIVRWGNRWIVATASGLVATP
ncbi:hypothetical protein [Bradyrhizobium sp. C9]|uniref:hypothetical protein n=1 Tax=Bradyrhizobium sp. C9 TaxID=142585 RepID=UPI001178ACEE|nr:hypothetical protein [Bradyrhizobium sp. C9]